MKTFFTFCLAWLAIGVRLVAGDFNVTSPDFYYEINGQLPNPTITLTRGQTYTFDINTDSSHPFAIATQDFDYNIPGAENNNIYNGTITYTVPMDAPDSMLYYCSVHYFSGTINIVNPAAPPAANVKIISVSLTSSNVTVLSVGTNGWTAVPEFSSNLLSAAWTPVPSFTNTYANGTNTSTFGRLEVICGPNVFLRVKNAPTP